MGTMTPSSEYSVSTDCGSINSWISSSSGFSAPFSVASSVDQRYHPLAHLKPTALADLSASPPRLPSPNLVNPIVPAQHSAFHSGSFRLRTPPTLHQMEHEVTTSQLALRRYGTALQNDKDASPHPANNPQFSQDITNRTHVSQVNSQPVQDSAQSIFQPTSQPQSQSMQSSQTIQARPTAAELWAEQRNKKALSALSSMLNVLQSLEEVVKSGKRITNQERVEKTTMIDRAWVELQMNLLTEDSHPPPEVQTPAPAPVLTPAPLPPRSSVESIPYPSSQSAPAPAQSSRSLDANQDQPLEQQQHGRPDQDSRFRQGSDTTVNVRDHTAMQACFKV